MNRKMRDIASKIEEKTKLAKSYMEDGENKNVKKAGDILHEIDELKREYDIEEKLYNLEKEKNVPNPDEFKGKSAEEKKKAVIKEFAAAARNGFRAKSMNEDTPAAGGYTVPEDIRTDINKYRDAMFSLLSLVRVEKVKTNSGSRTFQKRAQHKGFSVVGEGGKIGETSTPEFERLEYKITKKAGYLPVTNELLADSDENITNTIVEWFGEESRVTANNSIINVIKTVSETELDGLDGIKKALNVTLGQAYKNTSSIVTNDDGLQYLDTIKDSDGNYVLAKNPSDPMRLVLSAGATTVPIVVIPNSDLATSENKIPFFIGDLYEEDLTVFRGIERNDTKLRDSAAIINGYINAAEE